MTPGRAAPVDRRALAAVAAGGVVGSLGRWSLGLALPHAAGTFPWGTFLVNVSGALAMGLLVAFLVARPGTHRLARPFVGVGLLGGWTTYSALAVEAVGLARGDHVQTALLYVAATFLVGTLAVGVGTAAGRRLWVGP